jgi:hypothetical protein
MADLIGFLVGVVVPSDPAADANRQRDIGTLPGLIEPGTNHRKP